MVWNKNRILQELRRFNKAGKDLSYNSLAKEQQSLVSAAAYHYGSYRKAVEQAGIDYAIVARRPRWTKGLIISLIKQAKRDGVDLHWSSVTKRRDDLGKAAFAALQTRLFGRWDRALQASGLDADEVSRYRRWNRTSIVSDLKERSRESAALNSGAIQEDDPGLHAAAVRHFGSYDGALRAAQLNPTDVRRRHAWTKAEVVKAIKAASKAGLSLADSSVRKSTPALYGAAVRLYGTFTGARESAGVKFVRGGKRKSKKVLV
jgi:hypothetical protein